MALGNSIYITRGDTLNMAISIKDQDNNEYELVEGDTLLFTVKKSTRDSEVIIQKNILNKEFKIEPKDTENLPYDDYVYDVQLTQSDGDVTTVIKPSLFRVTEEVTW